MTGTCECGCGLPTPPCDRNHAPRGYVKGQPMRFIIGHNKRRGVPDYIVDENGCWIWQRRINPNGYGQLTRDGRQTYAHRYFYELHRGPVPEGLVLDHLCMVKECCNPQHLEPVTHAENCRRAVRARQAETESAVAA